MTPKLWLPEGAKELLSVGTLNADYWRSTLRPYVDGRDVVCRGVVATRFGGTDDDMDSGLTASGIDLHQHPDYLGVALPMRVIRERQGVKYAFPATAGSPLPRYPWDTLVRVSSRKTSKSAVARLCDIGPAVETGNGIDLTNALVRVLKLDLADGEYLVDFRIVGGAERVVMV